MSQCLDVVDVPISGDLNSSGYSLTVVSGHYVLQIQQPGPIRQVPNGVARHLHLTVPTYLITINSQVRHLSPYFTSGNNNACSTRLHPPSDDFAVTLY